MVSLQKLYQIFREELKPSLNNLSQKMEEEENIAPDQKIGTNSKHHCL